MSAKEDYHHAYDNRFRTGALGAQDIEMLCVKADKLEKVLDERAKLVEALAFYGDPGTYHAVAFLFDPPCGGFDDDFDEEHGEPFYDRPMPGKLARETLRGLV